MIIRVDRDILVQQLAEIGVTDDTAAEIIDSACPPPIWDDVPAAAQVDLIAWSNPTGEVQSNADLQRLAELYLSGRFEVWACPTCGDRVSYGMADQDSFPYAQQPDYEQYPGDATLFTADALARMCDHCRANLPAMWQLHRQTR